MSSKTKNKVLQMLSKGTTLSEKAKNIAENAKETLQKEILDELKAKIRKNENQTFDLENMPLETDANRNIQALSRDEIESNLGKIINLKFEKKILELELFEKQKAFDELFI
jgi:hypothetical protein